MSNACAWFNVALRPQKPKGSLGRGAQDVHLDFHTAPELCFPTQQGTCFVDDVELHVLGCQLTY